MALLLRAEELQGLISIPEAIAAVRHGFRDQGEKPAYSAPRIRIQHEDRRVSVRPGVEEVRVYSRSADNRAAFIAKMQPQVKARLVAAGAPEQAARGADLICLATGSNVPVLFGDWLEKGQHVTSIVASNKGVFEQ